MTVQDALPDLLQEYLPILIFLMIAIGLAVVMAFGSMIIGPSRPDSEKLSAYECGFEAFNDSRGQFDVRFYLVAILFIIFELCSFENSKYIQGLFDAKYRCRIRKKS